MCVDRAHVAWALVARARPDVCLQYASTRLVSPRSYVLAAARDAAIMYITPRVPPVSVRSHTPADAATRARSTIEKLKDESSEISDVCTSVLRGYDAAWDTRIKTDDIPRAFASFGGRGTSLSLWVALLLGIDTRRVLFDVPVETLRCSANVLKRRHVFSAAHVDVRRLAALPVYGNVLERDARAEHGDACAGIHEHDVCLPADGGEHHDLVRERPLAACTCAVDRHDGEQGRGDADDTGDPGLYSSGAYGGDSSNYTSCEFNASFRYSLLDSSCSRRGRDSIRDEHDGPV